MIDAPALGHAKLTVEIADATQADERTVTLIANQPQLITRLLAGHHYTVNLQPAMINNRFISAPIQLTGFILLRRRLPRLLSLTNSQRSTRRVS